MVGAVAVDMLGKRMLNVENCESSVRWGENKGTYDMPDRRWDVDERESGLERSFFNGWGFTHGCDKGDKEGNRSMQKDTNWRLCSCD